MTRIAVILGSQLHPADRAAVATAARLGGRVTALSAGEAPLRYAAATGAQTQWLNGHVPLFDLALVGSCEAYLTATIAGDAPLIFDALVVEPTNDVTAWRVTQDLGRGARQVLRVSGPAVVMMSDAAPCSLYVSRYRRSRAAVPPGGVAPHEPTWQPARPRARTDDLAARTTGSAADRAAMALGIDDSAAQQDDHIIAADARTCARHLLRYLAHHGFIDRAAGASEPLAATRATAAPVEQVVSQGSIPPYLARRPRPVGESVPRHVRGPYPVEVH